MRASEYKPTFIDAFAGCGGLSLGLLKAGWNGLFAIEKDPFAFETLASNLIEEGSPFPFQWPRWLGRQAWTIESLMDQHRGDLIALRGTIDLLAGGPPCQGFSCAGRRRPHDPRNQLVERYLEFVDLVRPRMVLIENVRGITHDFVDKDDLTARRNFASDVEGRLSASYHVYTQTIRCAEYGVPQNRPRFFLVGILKSSSRRLATRDDPFARLRACRTNFLRLRGLTPKVTASQAISDFSGSRASVGPCPDSAGYNAIVPGPARTSFQKLMRQGHAGPVSDTRLAKHRVHIVERFEKIIQECIDAGRLNVQLNREMRERHGIKKMATRVLDPRKRSPTITSMPDDLLHYAEPRTLTVRENARLQTFPDWFQFRGKYTTGGDRRAREVPRFTQVANAVPPLIAEMWGEVLLRYAIASRSTERLAA